MFPSIIIKENVLERQLTEVALVMKLKIIFLRTKTNLVDFICFQKFTKDFIMFQAGQ